MPIIGIITRSMKSDEGHPISIIYKQIEKIYNSEHRNWVDTIYLMENDKIIKNFKRKK